MSLPAALKSDLAAAKEKVEAKVVARQNNKIEKAEARAAERAKAEAYRNGLSPRSKKLHSAGAVLVAGLIAVGLVGCNAGSSGDDTTTVQSTNPVVAGVLSEIAAETDCGSLQASFDRGDASSERGYRLDGVNVGLLYMEAADKQMRSQGCYD